MLYNKRKPTLPANDGRNNLVRRMSATYEEIAHKRDVNALDAAGFEVILYKRLQRGNICTCTIDAHKDILDASGDLTSDAMNNILNPPNSQLTKSSKRKVSLGNYNDDTTYEELPGDDEASVYRDAPNREVDETDFNADDDYDDDEDTYNDDYDYNTFSATTVNCGVCNRTSFVGGFDRYGGMRIVKDASDFKRNEKLTNLIVNEDNAPNTMDIDDKDEMGEAIINIMFPISSISFKSMRVLNDHDILKSSDYQIFVKQSGSNTYQEVKYPSDLKQYADGFVNQLKIVTKKSFTHLEIELTTNQRPLLVDVTNWNKTSDYNSLNDFDSLTFSLPYYVEDMNRGDVIIDRNTNRRWIVTNVDTIRSPITSHGFTVMCDRLKGDYDNFTLPPPIWE